MRKNEKEPFHFVARGEYTRNGMCDGSAAFVIEYVQGKLVKTIYSLERKYIKCNSLNT